MKLKEMLCLLYLTKLVLFTFTNSGEINSATDPITGL